MFWNFIVLVVGLTSLSLIGSQIPVTGASVYSQMPSICTRPPPRSEGYCTISIEGYYFDPRINTCVLYEVGGCRLIPGQSFGSREDCLATCIYLTRNIQDIRVD